MEYKYLQIYDSGKIIAYDRLEDIPTFSNYHPVKPMVIENVEIKISEGTIKIGGSEIDNKGNNVKPGFKIIIIKTNFTFVYYRKQQI